MQARALHEQGILKAWTSIPTIIAHLGDDDMFLHTGFNLILPPEERSSLLQRSVQFILLATAPHTSMVNAHNRANRTLHHSRSPSRSVILERILVLYNSHNQSSKRKHAHPSPITNSPFKIPSLTSTSIGGLDANCCSNELLLIWRSRLLCCESSAGAALLAGSTFPETCQLDVTPEIRGRRGWKRTLN